jgi:hypothetical protein
VLTCVAESSPAPAIQWLQQLPATGEVLVRGYERDLVIERIGYEHQGDWVCRASNAVGDVQSEPIRLEVRGGPTVDKFATRTEHVLERGEDGVVSVRYCASPRPARVAWNIGPVGIGGKSIELEPGLTHGRFRVESPTASSAGQSEAGNSLQEDEKTVAAVGDMNAGGSGSGSGSGSNCQVSHLTILGAQLGDGRDYIFTAENEFGRDTVAVRLVVIDTTLISQEILTAIIVGGVLTILILTLIIIYLVKADRCCGAANTSSSSSPKNNNNGHLADLGSDRTDVESCHSSNTASSSGSGSGGGLGHSALPPDALYGTVEKQQQRAYFEHHLFNDSKERLRPDLVGAAISSSSSRGGSPYTTTAVGGGQAYGDLSCPKSSNSGSMKRKKKRDVTNAQSELRSQGVDCQLNSSISFSSPTGDHLYSYSARAPAYVTNMNYA